MKGKNISTQSNKLLTWFNSRDQICFPFREAFAALPESSESAVKQLLSDMTLRGLLMRLKEGVYFIIPYEADSDSYMPDWHLVAQCLVGGAEHYIGYYSALQIHNLITQPSLKEQIVVSRQFRPSVIRIKNIPFQFVYHNENHFFGMKKMWIDNFHQVQCSDLEKTIIDCLFKPNYAGGIVEIARAIFASTNQIQYNRLLEYVIRFKSQAIIKRLGFILEMLEIDTEITHQLQKMRSVSYVALDTKLPRKGKMISRWSIIQNVEYETIQSAIYA